MAEYIAEKRIWIDEDTRNILDFVCYMSRDDILDFVIEEWINKEIENDKKMRLGYEIENRMIYLNDYSERIVVNVREEIWGEFLKYCEHRGYNVSIAFKNAIFEFARHLKLIYIRDT